MGLTKGLEYNKDLALKAAKLGKKGLFYNTDLGAKGVKAGVAGTKKNFPNGIISNAERGVSLLNGGNKPEPKTKTKKGREAKQMILDGDASFEGSPQHLSIREKRLRNDKAISEINEIRAKRKAKEELGGVVKKYEEDQMIEKGDPFEEVPEPEEDLTFAPTPNPIQAPEQKEEIPEQKEEPKSTIGENRTLQQRRSLESDSGRYMRLARKYRRKGFGKAAGSLAMMAARDEAMGGGGIRTQEQVQAEQRMAGDSINAKSGQFNNLRGYTGGEENPYIRGQAKGVKIGEKDFKRANKRTPL